MTRPYPKTGYIREEVNIMVLFPYIEISFVRIQAGSDGEENLMKVWD